MAVNTTEELEMKRKGLRANIIACIIVIGGLLVAGWFS